MAQVQQAGTPILATASGYISLSPGSLIGYHVNSTSGGTIIFALSSGGTAVSGTITPGIGFQAFPAYFPASCYASVGGTISVTFFFAAG